MRRIAPNNEQQTRFLKTIAVKKDRADKAEQKGELLLLNDEKTRRRRGASIEASLHVKIVI